MAPEGTQSLLPAASGRIKAFLWKDDCHISWQQKFHTSSPGKLTLFAWKAAILAGLLSLSATFHYSWQPQGKHNGKAVVQLPDSPGILSGKLWDDSVHRAGLSRSDSTTPGEGQSHSQGAKVGPGTHLEQEEPPAASGWVCPALLLSWPSPHSAQPGWEAGLGSLQGWPRAAPRAVRGQQGPATLLPSSPHTGSTA